MTVLVTGGSGFVGSHIVAALAAAGHEVRVLARDPDRTARALAPHGQESVEVAAGDVTDARAVAAAVDGCQAVIHATNVYSYDPRRGAEMRRTNVEGTEIVLDAALRAGCDPVVHVSTNLILFPANGPIPADPPLGTNDVTPYIGSKLAAERIARRHQENGVPVVTTYPGAVFGPFDPGPGEMIRLLHSNLGSLSSIRLSGQPGFGIADARWVARVHAGLVTPGTGPRRVAMSGHYITLPELVGILRTLTGRRLPQVLPAGKRMAMTLGRAMDALQRVVPARMPLSYEETWILYASAPTDDSAAVSLAGPPPPLEETLADAIWWAVEAGHVPAKWAGQLVTTPDHVSP